MKHSLLQTHLKALVLHSLDTLSDVRLKAFMLLFYLKCSVYSKPKPTLLGASSLCCKVLLLNFQ